MAKYGGEVGRDDKEAPATSVMKELVDNWGMAILDLTLYWQERAWKGRGLNDSNFIA